MPRDLKELKSAGFLPQVQEGRFSLRIRVVGGQVTTEQLDKVRRLAELYGSGYVHLTSRQSLEVPFIKLEDIDKVEAFLHENGLAAAFTGPKVRTITACQGKAICASGLIDTTDLAKGIDQRFGGQPVPHKFKIGVTGCRNNCLKAEENDIGVKGALEPSWNETNCTYCGACAKICPGNAITVDREAKQLHVERESCLSCGRCVKVCPQKSWQGEQGFLLFFGGLYGNRIVIGKKLLPVIKSPETVYAIIDETLRVFEEHGKKNERFCTMLDRVGWQALEQRLQKFQH